MTQSPRTKAKITENLGLLMEHVRKKYGSVDEDTEMVLFNALSWTADDVEEQTREQEAKLREALDRVNDVRNSLIGYQGFNFSMHAYPLVAALNAVGIE